MAAPGIAPISVQFDGTAGPSNGGTQGLLSAMLRATDQISDLIFSPGLHALSADDTRRIAADLIGSNKQAITMLREQGSCDISYGLPGLARFRVNVFIQRGSCAIVMRVIPTVIPTFAALGMPEKLRAIAD